jgi:hypothetical protein
MQLNKAYDLKENGLEHSKLQPGKDVQVRLARAV